MIWFEFEIVFKFSNLRCSGQVAAFESAFENQSRVALVLRCVKTLQLVIVLGIDLAASPACVFVLGLASYSHRLNRLAHKGAVIDQSCRELVWTLRQIVLQGVDLHQVPEV